MTANNALAVARIFAVPLLNAACPSPTTTDAVGVTSTWTEPAPVPGQRDGPVAIPTLAAHWHVALDTAEAAVTASLRAELLPSDFCAAELRHLRSETAWLDHDPFA